MGTDSSGDLPLDQNKKSSALALDFLNTISDKLFLHKLILPQTVRLFIVVHDLETDKVVADQQDDEADGQNLQSRFRKLLDMIQNGLHEKFHKKFNDSGKSHAGRYGCVFCKMKRHFLIIPVCKSAEVFHRFSQNDFPDADNHNHQGKVRKIYQRLTGSPFLQPLFRRSENQVNPYDSQSVSEQKREKHIPVVNILLCQCKPDTLNTISQKRNNRNGQ